MAPQQTLQQLARMAGTVRLMNEDFRLECLATGCEPTCHFCDVRIELDQPFGFRKLPTQLPTQDGLVQGFFVPSASAMACGECLTSATPTQVEHALKTAGVRLAGDQGDLRVALLAKSTEKPVREAHAGCFITDDGRVF